MNFRPTAGKNVFPKRSDSAEFLRLTLTSAVFRMKTPTIKLIKPFVKCLEKNIRTSLVRHYFPSEIYTDDSICKNTLFNSVTKDYCEGV